MKYLLALFAILLVLASQCAAHAGELPVDPMRPNYVRPKANLPHRLTTRSPARLQAVIGTPRQRLAIIDGDIVRLGERFKGAEIVRIDRDQVQLKSGRRRWSLRLPPSASR